jgi:hypothetical protein
MKKLMMLALGLGLVLGTVSFAQDAPKTDDKAKPAKKAKAKKKKADDKKTADAPKM